ncbi:MAG TPA: hypothetical protein VLJ39_05760 [Tepidisphaeraceae bacterium]|nr:hypothetical protein [Tepidisphaeraceae bacterium]
MQAIETPGPSRTLNRSAASERAAANREANERALQQSQPDLCILELPPDLEWVFARDGSLTALLGGSTWWAGCSLPKRAARFMLKDIDVAGVTACFLHPTHAAQLRVALGHLEARQAILAIQPDPKSLAVALHCEDFSQDIAAGRLWFVAGEDWPAALEALLARNPGLPTPSQFIRPILSEPEAADRLIEPAQAVFTEVGARRTAILRERAAELLKIRPPTGRVCVVAPTTFRLWDDAGRVLREIELAGSGFTVRPFDPDQPTCASPLALAEMASDCDAVIAPNLYRSSVPEMVSAGIPWISWVTSPRIPSADGSSKRDRLLLADKDWQAAAQQAGWTPSQIRIAGWPPVANASHPSRMPAGLALVADTVTLTPPKHVESFSSHLLLWEHIRAELTSDPFAIDDVHDYLKTRMARYQIDSSGFDAGAFVDGLVVPAFQQGVANLLFEEGLAFSLFGKGWNPMQFGTQLQGPVTSRQQLRAIVSGASALVHLWPTQSHPVLSSGPPVIRAFGRSRTQFLNDVRRAPLLTHAQPHSLAAPVLNADLLASVLKNA